MSQYTAVIDIGSNSVRLVIYNQPLHSKSFHIIYEEKFKVRIGEGAYLKGGYLQPKSMQRAYFALQSFRKTLENYPSSKIFTVATSALRDAPNRLIFTKWIEEELKLDIEIIDGDKEAELSAIAAQYLLPIKSGITIDIGGGSTDIALIKDNRLLQTYSLNLGTVRLKELFEHRDKQQREDYIKSELKRVPSSFSSSMAIGIGGTARSLSKAIMHLNHIESHTIHNFRYKVEDYKPLFNKITSSSEDRLRALNISKNRVDTIREGTTIWQNILEKIGATEVISSAVGLREGIFLERGFKGDLNHGVSFTP